MSPGPKPGHGPTSLNSALGHDSTGLTSNSRSNLYVMMSLSHGINSRQGALFLLTVLTSPCPVFSLLCLATNFQLSPSSAGARLGPVLSTVTAAGLPRFVTRYYRHWPSCLCLLPAPVSTPATFKLFSQQTQVFPWRWMVANPTVRCL